MPEPIHWIRDPKKIAALGSPVRQRLLDRLEALGPASVRELAASLSVPPDRLYYHVRILERVGVVQAVGSRGAGREEEVEYDLFARRWHIAYEPSDADNRAAVERLTAAMLRQAGRDFEAGFDHEGVAVRGRARNLWSLRLEASLTRAELRELNDHLQAIVALLRKPRRRAGGAPCALTWVLAPLALGDADASAAGGAS
ncbi:MAG: helix-turn-helix transcriptional regulator [Myxococcales bacterium]|nr:helix-turn-helix transcriptional regulator [Myxococcales bacterium]